MWFVPPSKMYVILQIVFCHIASTVTGPDVPTGISVTNSPFNFHPLKIYPSFVGLNNLFGKSSSSYDDLFELEFVPPFNIYVIVGSQVAVKVISESSFKLTVSVTLLPSFKIHPLNSYPSLVGSFKYSLKVRGKFIPLNVVGVLGSFTPPFKLKIIL